MEKNWGKVISGEKKKTEVQRKTCIWGGKDAERADHSYTAGGNVNWRTLTIVIYTHVSADRKSSASILCLFLIPIAWHLIRIYWMSLGTVPGAVELKLNGQKLAYVYYKKDENIIFSNYNCPAVI